MNTSTFGGVTTHASSFASLQSACARKGFSMAPKNVSTYCVCVCACVCVCVCVCGWVGGWVGGWVWVCVFVCVWYTHTHTQTHGKGSPWRPNTWAPTHAHTHTHTHTHTLIYVQTERVLHGAKKYIHILTHTNKEAEPEKKNRLYIHILRHIQTEAVFLGVKGGEDRDYSRSLELRVVSVS
jgi:hypothetical protein